MEKPTTLKIKETREEIIKLVNASDLPAFVIANVVKEISEEIQQISENIARKEEEMYKQSLNEEKKGEEVDGN